MSDTARTTELSDNPRDYLSGASRDTINATEGGTTRDGKVAVFGPTAAVHPVGDDGDDD